MSCAPARTRATPRRQRCLRTRRVRDRRRASARVGPVEEPTDQPDVVVGVEAGVDENERDEILEAGKEGLADRDPRPDRGAGVDRVVVEPACGMVAVSTHHVGWVVDALTRIAASEDQPVCSRRLPERSRLFVDGWEDAGHAMAPASFSAMIPSQSYPSSSRTDSVCSPCSGAGRSAGDRSSNCTGTEGSR